MTQQFVHNVNPGQRQFVTQAGGQPAHVVNGGRPTIDSRHLDGPPGGTASPFSGPEFERNARALMSLLDLYANGIKDSGSVPAGISVEDLKQLPLARLQQLYYAAPLKPTTANANPGGGSLGLFLREPAGAGEFEGYDPGNPTGS